MGRVFSENWHRLVVLVWLAAAASAVSAELLISAPPRESMEQAQKLYGPIAELLSKQIGENVKYTHPNNWIEYINNMRKGTYDIVFDGPHFAAWRMKHLNHAPIAKLPGSLVFVLLVHADDARIAHPRDIRSGAICGLAPPNLGSMAVLAAFPNPVMQPDIVEGVDFPAVIATFMAGKCRGAVVPERLFRKMSEAERKQVRVVYTSPPFPDQTITVGPKVNDKARVALRLSLAVPGGLPEVRPLLGAYSKQATQFDVALESEYVGLADMLEGEIWGW